MPGVARGLDGAGRPVVKVRTGDSFFAVRDTCSHRRARFSDGFVTGTVLPCQIREMAEYGRVGEFLWCPWHGWQCDLKTGRSPVDPEHVRVRCYLVRVVDDRAMVTLS